MGVVGRRCELIVEGKNDIDSNHFRELFAAFSVTHRAAVITCWKKTGAPLKDTTFFFFSSSVSVLPQKKSKARGNCWDCF